MRFGLNIWDERTQAAAVPGQQGFKLVMLMQDNFSRLLEGLPMETRQIPQLIATCNALLDSMSAGAQVGIEVNKDAASGFGAPTPPPSCGRLRRRLSVVPSRWPAPAYVPPSASATRTCPHSG